MLVTGPSGVKVLHGRKLLNEVRVLEVFKMIHNFFFWIASSSESWIGCECWLQDLALGFLKCAKFEGVNGRAGGKCSSFLIQISIMLDHVG